MAIGSEGKEANKGFEGSKVVRRCCWVVRTLSRPVSGESVGTGSFLLIPGLEPRLAQSLIPWLQFAKNRVGIDDGSSLTDTVLFSPLLALVRAFLVLTMTNENNRFGWSVS